MFVTANVTRKYQQITDGSSGGSGGQIQQQVPVHSQPTAQPTAQGGAFANLMSRLGFGSNQQTTMPATNNQQQQPTAQPATNSQQQAPQQAAPLPSEFFGKLFTPQEPAQSNSKGNNEPPPNPWDVSPDTLTKNFGNLDISQFVKQEDVTAALGGDASAFMNILNTAVKIGAMSAHQASVTTTQQGVELSTKKLQQQLPEQMKNFTLENNLGQDPVLSAPHLQPVVKLVKDSILAHYPKATEADIKEGVIAYLQDLGGKFSTQTNNNSQPQATSSINWDEHFKTL